jgi:hypothetical protein
MNKSYFGNKYMKSITKKTTLDKILTKPGSEEILRKYKVPCLGCAFARMEMNKLKIGEICELYGIEVKPLLEDLNKL